MKNINRVYLVYKFDNDVNHFVGYKIFSNIDDGIDFINNRRKKGAFYYGEMMDVENGSDLEEVEGQMKINDLM